jgi:hypothetical protein
VSEARPPSDETLTSLWGQKPFRNLLSLLCLVAAAYFGLWQLGAETADHGGSLIVEWSCYVIAAVVLALSYRVYLHIRGDYLGPGSPCRKHVMVEAGFDILLAVMTVAAYESSGFGLAGSLAFPVLWLAMAIAQGAQTRARNPASSNGRQRKSRLPSGSKVFCTQTWAGQKLDKNSEGWDNESPLARIRDLIKRPIEPGQPSAALCLVMVLFLYASVAQAAEETFEEATSPAKDSATKTKTGTKSGQAMASAGSPDSSPEPIEPVLPPKPQADQLCPTNAEAGGQAPEPQRSALADLWRHYGAAEAGCPSPAREVGSHPGVWYVVGHCPGRSEEVQSLGVATAVEPAALLFDQAGEYAAGLAESGQLLGASGRFAVGPAGDAYVIDADDGSHVLVREESGAGVAVGGTACDPNTTVDRSYITVPPALLGGWLAVAGANDEPVWPMSATNPDGSLTYTFNVAGQTVAEATCSSDLSSCTTTFNGQSIAGAPGRYIDQDELERVVFELGV